MAPRHGLVEVPQRFVKVRGRHRRRGEDVAEEGGPRARVGGEQDHLRHGEPQLLRETLAPFELRRRRISTRLDNTGLGKIMVPRLRELAFRGQREPGGGIHAT